MYFYPQDGWTALHLAAQEGKVDVVRLLTEAQAQVNTQDEVYIKFFVYKSRYITLSSHLSIEPSFLLQSNYSRITDVS